MCTLLATDTRILDSKIYNYVRNENKYQMNGGNARNN